MLLDDVGHELVDAETYAEIKARNILDRWNRSSRHHQVREPAQNTSTSTTAAGHRSNVCWVSTGPAPIFGQILVRFDEGNFNLAKLAQFRDKLRDERNVAENRVHGRNRRGVTLVKRDGSVGMSGPYTMEYRQKLLTSLTDLKRKLRWN